MPWPAWQEDLQSCQIWNSHLLLEQVDSGRLPLAEGSRPNQSQNSCQVGQVKVISCTQALCILQEESRVGYKVSRGARSFYVWCGLVRIRTVRSDSVQFDVRLYGGFGVWAFGY
jgi:hypothetical protein